MSHERTVARPYARAVFDIAKECKEVPSWLSNLGAIHIACKDSDDLSYYLRNPNLSSNKLEDSLSKIFEIVLEKSNSELKGLVSNVETTSSKPNGWSNFIALLLRKKRASLLPFIAEIFVELVREDNSVVAVSIKSANSLSEDEINVLKDSLTKRVDQKIDLTVDVLPELIGGALIKIGDTVIDGTVKGKVEAMRNALLN